MNVTIINDCRDSNAVGRQIARVSSLLDCSANFIGVSSGLEAAGNLIDVLDALENRQGLILVNIAPRNHEAKKWINGTPFGYFWYKNTLVVSSIDGLVLSLVKKLKLTDTIKVLNIPTVVDALVKQGQIPGKIKKQIADSQFRSYEFLPMIGAYLIKNNDIIHKKLSIKKIPDATSAIWFTDNFGNCKTSLLKKDVKINSGNRIKTKFGEVGYYECLKDVPDEKIALVSGSSGLYRKRFIELVKQGGSAEKHFKLSLGDKIL